jgi:CBS domain-containing protein/nucleotide-binding universal stress UspA family protein
MMLVGQWMTKDPLTIGPKESIVTARAILRQRGIRRLPVVDGDRVVGIVTDRDLREAWASDATSLAAYELTYMLEHTPVRDIMTSPVVTVSPETPLEEAVALLQAKKIGGVPVLREDRLVGILTETDVFRAFGQVLRFGNVEGRPDLRARPAPPAGRVLVPILGATLSPKVVREACRLAAQLGLHPKIVLIMNRSLHLEEIRIPGDTRAFDEIVAGLLADYRGIAKSLGVEAETDFRSGDPATVALEEITSGHYDFVVAGRRTPLHLGSSRLELEKVGFTARLLETSPVPVLVVSEAVQV